MRVRMRLIGLVPAMVALSLSTQAFSQEWIESVHIESRFTANLPEEPIMDEYTMTSEYGPTLTVRRYTAHDQYGGRYVVTVRGVNVPWDPQPFGLVVRGALTDCAAPVAPPSSGYSSRCRGNPIRFLGASMRGPRAPSRGPLSRNRNACPSYY